MEDPEEDEKRAWEERLTKEYRALDTTLSMQSESPSLADLHRFAKQKRAKRRELKLRQKKSE